MKPYHSRPSYTPLTQALLLRYLHTSHPETGFTLLEALVAMFIIAIILSFIGAPILMTAGSRVKNQKTEYALQLAQQRLENARITLALTSTWTTEDLNDDGILNTGEDKDGNGTLTISPDPSGIPKKTITSDFNSSANVGKVLEVKAPTARCGTAALIGTAVTCDSALKMEAVDIDKDNVIDFYVQAFRTNQIVSPSDGKVLGFDMSLRIYAPQAYDSLTNSVSLSTTAASATMTSNPLSATNPLTVSYTTLSQGESSQSLIAMNQCTVVNVVGQAAATTANLTSVKTTLNAGLSKPFTVTFTSSGAASDPANPVVTSQSLTVGSKALCGSAITIQYEGTATPP